MAWCKTNALILGVDLPIEGQINDIVASNGNKALYAIGNNLVSNKKDIFKFTCTNSIKNCSWSKIQTKLQYDRKYSVAMAIPDALANKLCSTGK